MREALLFCFNLKKSAAESYRMLEEAYGDKKLKNRPRKVEYHQLQALLDEDDTQSQKMLAEQLVVTQSAKKGRIIIKDMTS